MHVFETATKKTPNDYIQENSTVQFPELGNPNLI